MEQEIKLKVELNIKDLIEFDDYENSTMYMNFRFVGILFLILCIVTKISSGRFLDWDGRWFLLLFFGLLFTLLQKIQRGGVKKRFEQLDMAHTGQSYGVSDTGIIFESQSKTTNLVKTFTWDKINKVLENNGSFYLYDENKCVYIIPTRSFDTEEQINLFRDIYKTGLNITGTEEKRASKFRPYLFIFILSILILISFIYAVTSKRVTIKEDDINSYSTISTNSDN